MLAAPFLNGCFDKLPSGTSAVMIRPIWALFVCDDVRVSSAALNRYRVSNLHQQKIFFSSKFFYVAQMAEASSCSVRPKRLRSSGKANEVHRPTSVKMQLPICPLTLELPTEPVIASDGKVYELSAWKQYKKSMKKKTLVSPVTKQKIRGKVYPAVDIKAMIEDAVKDGHVPDDMCSRWKDKISREAKFQQMLKDAQKDPALWDHLGDCYNYGTDTPQCYAEAIKCYKKSYEQVHCAESLRKLSMLMCLRPETTRTDIINSWATICTLTLESARAIDMILTVLVKLPNKVRLRIKSGFPLSVDLSHSHGTKEMMTMNENKQVDRWAKELALFLKDNSKSTRADDSDSDDSEEEEVDESDPGSEWEDYNAELFE